MNVLRPVRLLFFLGFLLVNLALSAQTASCDDPGNFSITPPQGTTGSGTAADPWVMCTDAILTFVSEGVNPTLGLPNPGLGFMLYNDQPTVQDNVLFDPAATLLIFGMMDGAPVLDNGTAAFPFGLPAGTFTIVPVIIENVGVMPFTYQECTGVDLNGAYPVVTFVDPAVNPDCSVGCTAAIASISTDDNTTFCSSQEVPPNEINVTAEGLSGSMLLYVADQAGNIIAGPYMDGFVAGTDFSQDAQIYAVAYQGDLPPQVMNISELPSGECGALSTNSIPVVWLEGTSGSPITNSPTTVCASIENQITVLNNGGSGTIWFVLTDGESIIQQVSEEGTFMLPAGAPGTCLVYSFGFTGPEPAVEIGVTSAFDLSSECSGLSFDPITINKVDDLALCGDDCTADAGTTPTLDNYFLCPGEIIQFFYEGGGGDGLSQISLMVDASGNIVDYSDNLHSSEFFTPGQYTGYTLSLATDEIGDIDAWIGQSVEDLVAGFICFDLNEMAETIFILESVQTTAELSCFSCTGLGEITFTVPGALGAANIFGSINGVGFNADMIDGSISFDFDNTEPLVNWNFSITTNEVCSFLEGSSVCEDDCEGLTAGTIATDNPTTFCLDDDTEDFIDVAFPGSNGCGIVFLLADESGNLIAPSQFDGVFNFTDAAAGVCYIYAVAFGDANPPLFDVGTLVSEIPDFGCFALSENSIEVIRQEGVDCGLGCEDPEILDVNTVCNPAGNPLQLWTFTVTPELSYEIAGAPATQVSNDIIELAIDPGIPFEFTITNPAGCSTTYSNANDVDLACEEVECEAAVGVVTADVIPSGTCLSQGISVSTTGGNADYVTYYVLIDLGLFITHINTTGSFVITPGTYSVNVVNVPVEETVADPQALIGSFSLDFFDSFNCSDLFTVNEPIFLEGMTLTYEEFCMDDSISMATVTLMLTEINGLEAVIGIEGLPDFTTLIGQSFDVPITEGEVLEIDWITDDNCIGDINTPVAGNPCGDQPICEALAGAVSVDAEFICSGGTVSAASVGSNAAYADVFLLWQNGTVLMANESGLFNPASGSYSVSSLNLPVEDLTVDAGLLTDPVANFECFEASNVVDVVVLAAVVVSHDYVCDEGAGVFEVTYSFSGGLPDYVNANGSVGIDGESSYQSTGDLTSEVFLGENFTVEYPENQTYNVVATDALGCSDAVSFTPDPCTKTAIELLYLRAAQKEASNVVQWATASEGEGDLMVLQLSDNGSDFSNARDILSLGSNVTNTYDFTDEAITSTKYYRLMIVDAQGLRTYSDIISVVRKANDQISVYPNPINDVLTIQDLMSGSFIELYDVTGKVIYNSKVQESQIRIDLSDFPSGVYHLIVQHEGGAEFKRLLKN